MLGKMCVSEERLVAMLPAVASYSHIFYNVPSSVKELKEDYLVSKLWRLNNIFKIVGKESLDGDELVVDFVMNMAQLSLYCSLMVHPRWVVLKSRQRGISSLGVMYLGDDMITIPELRCGIIAQDQISGDGLKGKISKAWELMDSDVKAFFDVEVIINNNAEWGLSNGSRIGAKLSFRSGTLHRLLWTEVGKICNTDMARVTETKSGSLQTIVANSSNIVLLESTAEGANDFKVTYDTASLMAGKPITNKMYRALFYSWLTDLDCVSDSLVEVGADVLSVVADIEREYSLYIGSEVYREQIGNFIYPEGHVFKLSSGQIAWLVGVLHEMNFDLELFYREYPHTPASAFYVSNESLWYKDGLKRLRESGRLVERCLYNPDYEVFCVMDLGSTDLWYCGYVQVIDSGRVNIEGISIWEYHLLDVDYASYLKVGDIDTILLDKPYSIDCIYLPHDGVHERMEGNSIDTQFQELGWVTDIIPRTGLVTGIMNVRRKLDTFYVNMLNCSDVIDRLEMYRKRYNKVTKTYEANAVHDDASHGADMIRYLMQIPRVCELVEVSKPYMTDEGFSV